MLSAFQWTGYMLYIKRTFTFLLIEVFDCVKNDYLCLNIFYFNTL